MKKNAILYVDDEQSNLRGFKSLFFTDYKIFTAPSAKEGLEILAEHEIDMVISDQKMPEISGVEFLKEVARLYPDTIRIILTGYSDLEVIIRAVNECGIFRYMAKPWNLDEMKLTLDKGLESYRLKKENNFLIDRLTNTNQILEDKVNERTHQLDQQNQMLKKINKDKDDLIGIVAHDLKGPLNQICGIVNLMKLENFTDNARFQEYIEVVDASAGRLRKMITQVLEVNALETDGVKLVNEKLDIKALFQEVIRLYKPAADKKHLNIDMVVDPDFELISDKFHLVQILENLLSNAIKYSPDTATITFKAVKDKDGKLVISIRDEGPGFSEEDKKRLFTPYQKLSAKPSAGESSSGLGLSIVKKYADELQAQIYCESEPNKGACFVIKFINEISTDA